MPKMDIEIRHPKTGKLTELTARYEWDDEEEPTKVRLFDSEGKQLDQDMPLYEEIEELACEEIVEWRDEESDDDE